MLYGPCGTVIELSWRWSESGCNNEAEYRALNGVLQALVVRKAQRVRVWGDSDLVVRQLRGEQPEKATRLALWRGRVMALSAAFTDLQAEWIPRHRNGRADRLAGQANGSDFAPRQAHDPALLCGVTAHDGVHKVASSPIPRS